MGIFHTYDLEEFERFGNFVEIICTMKLEGSYQFISYYRTFYVIDILHDSFNGFIKRVVTFQIREYSVRYVYTIYIMNLMLLRKNNCFPF